MATFKKYQKLVADKVNSTYWWIIELDHSHPSNYNPNVKEITGYSKFQGHDEARDKHNLFESKVIMLFQRGYHQRSHRITIYMKNPDDTMVLKETSIPLFVLERRDFKIDSAEMLDEKTFRIKEKVEFLTKLYTSSVMGKDITYLVKQRRIIYTKDDFFNVDKHTFLTQAHLIAYCQKKIADGHPKDQATNFFRKYLEKHPHLK